MSTKQAPNNRAMMWTPNIAESDNFPSNLDKGLLYSLARIVNFQSESRQIKLFDGVKIIHGSDISSPWGKAFKGDDCWKKEEIRRYQKKNGKGRQSSISAYRGAMSERAYMFEYSCGWANTEFYLEAITDAGQENQAKISQLTRAALLSLLVLSKNRISTVKSIEYMNVPELGNGHGFSSYGHQIKKPKSPTESPFLLKKSEEATLADLAQQIFEKIHPEAYLASLRLLRAVNRHDLDDSIVDLVIGLEALLNEGNESGIRLRISQRLARLLNQPKSLRRQTDQVVKAAYQLRSNLVHGSKRQIESLEDILMDKKTDRKLLKHDQLIEQKMQLVTFVSSALFARYVEHGDKNQKELFQYLDDKAM